jgi:hypothetical protein
MNQLSYLLTRIIVSGLTASLLPASLQAQSDLPETVDARYSVQSQGTVDSQNTVDPQSTDSLVTERKYSLSDQVSAGGPVPGPAAFGSGTQVELEADEFPERREAQRQVLQDQQTPQPVFTRQTRFGIPFHITPGAVIVEAQLFVSVDRGATWSLYSRQLPQAGEFPFQTNQDGEFWYAIKTIDANGIISAKGNPQPEMIVVVDTTNPEFSLNVHTDPSGKLECWWMASDPALQPDSLEVYYRPHSPFRMNLARWKPAEIDKSKAQQAGSRYEDRSAFWPETESLTLDVQARISDRAGNVTVVDRRVLLSRTAPAKAETSGSRPPSVDPYAAQQAANARSIRWQDEARARTASNDNGWQSTPQPLLAEQQDKSMLAAARERTTADFATQIPPRRGFEDQNSQAIASQSTTPTSGGWQPSPNDNSATNAMRTNKTGLATTLASDDSRERNLSDPTSLIDPYYSKNGDSEMPSTANTSTPADTGTLADFHQRPASIHRDLIRLSNSRRFQLDYEVDLIGNAGVEKVEVWITSDEGRNWYVWGTDEDRASPVVVSVDQDGLYGFRIGVIGQNGLSARPPKSGDEADVWIGVDTTKPVAQITAVPYGTGGDAGNLIIQWQASDRQLTNQPISLFYSISPDGPWNEIARDLQNSGSYKWRIDERLPREVYLRLEAVDVASNKTVYLLGKPISLAGLVPRGRIRNVQPLQ